MIVRLPGNGNFSGGASPSTSFFVNFLVLFPKVPNMSAFFT